LVLPLAPVVLESVYPIQFRLGFVPNKVLSDELCPRIGDESIPRAIDAYLAERKDEVKAGKQAKRNG
jgi:hypothetical protein